MFCVNCFAPHTNVVNSRPHKRTPAVWRRRKCPQCQHIFSTAEMPEPTANLQIHNAATGSLAAFNPGKLTISIANAFQHNEAKGKQEAWELMRTVTGILVTDYRHETTVQDITTVTHQVLQRYDGAAAMSYALQHGLLKEVRRRGKPKFSAASSPISPVLPAVETRVSPFRSHRTGRDTFRTPNESEH
jgi:transcriptional regulator NrdR family protein